MWLRRFARPRDIIAPWLIELLPPSIALPDTRSTCSPPLYRGGGNTEFEGIRFIGSGTSRAVGRSDLTIKGTVERVRSLPTLQVMAPFYVLAGIARGMASRTPARFDIVHVHWPCRMPGRWAARLGRAVVARGSSHVVRHRAALGEEYASPG